MRYSRVRRSVGAMPRRLGPVMARCDSPAGDPDKPGHDVDDACDIGAPGYRHRLGLARLIHLSRRAAFLLSGAPLLPIGAAWARGPLLLPDSPAPVLSTIDPKSLGAKGARGDSVAAAELGTSLRPWLEGAARPGGGDALAHARRRRRRTGWRGANSDCCCCAAMASRAIRSGRLPCCERRRRPAT